MEKYLEPEMEITEFNVEDIITTSNDEWDPTGGFGWEEEEEEPW